MPGGNACRILPFGPCTSTAPSTTLTVTPFGIVIGFLPIRDIVHSPHIAEHFAADARFHGRLTRHDAARRRQDARAEAGQHVRHVVPAEIDAAARTADPLDAGDQTLAPRTVLEKSPERLP